jgi:hypothetical protein
MVDNNSNPLFDLESVTYHYDAEGSRLGYSVDGTDATFVPLEKSFDEPVIVRLRGSQESTEDRNAAEAANGDDYRGRYEWIGRELDADTALQYNRVGKGCDPTQGRFIEEE